MKIKDFFQGRFMSHPLHPALVHLPVGLWILSLITDLLSLGQSDMADAQFFARASWWAILIGVIAAVPAALAGFAEFLDIPSSTKAQKLAITHMGINIALLVGYIVQLVLRDPEAYELSTSLVVFNAIEFLVLGASGYIGGLMVYEQKIGVRTPDSPQEQLRAGKFDADLSHHRPAGVRPLMPSDALR